MIPQVKNPFLHAFALFFSNPIFNLVFINADPKYWSTYSLVMIGKVVMYRTECTYDKLLGTSTTWYGTRYPTFRSTLCCYVPCNLDPMIWRSNADYWIRIFLNSSVSLNLWFAISLYSIRCQPRFLYYLYCISDKSLGSGFLEKIKILCFTCCLSTLKGIYGFVSTIVIIPIIMLANWVYEFFQCQKVWPVSYGHFLTGFTDKIISVVHTLFSLNPFFHFLSKYKFRVKIVLILKKVIRFGNPVSPVTRTHWIFTQPIRSLACLTPGKLGLNHYFEYGSRRAKMTHKNRKS